MQERSYTAHVVALKKTKLGESDLIVSFLAEDGSQIRAVAKGARKPKSAFASRVEPCTILDAHFASGKNLDIVKDLRVVESNSTLKYDFMRGLSASPVCEFLDKASQPDLPVPRLFAMTTSCFSHMKECSEKNAALLCGAYLLKASSLLGFKPSFDACIGCGTPVSAEAGGIVSFAEADGGTVCSACAARFETVPLDSALLGWLSYCLGATFDEICNVDIDDELWASILSFAKAWVSIHVGIRLKSVGMLLGCASDSAL